MSSRHSLPALAAALLLSVAASAAEAPAIHEGERLPTGARITPAAAPGAAFTPLNPDLPSRPDFTAGQAVTSALGPDGRTLLILTSGYNRNSGPTGQVVPAESNEYVFVYDVSTHPPVKRQVLAVRNTCTLRCSRASARGTASRESWRPPPTAVRLGAGPDPSAPVALVRCRLRSRLPPWKP